MKKTQQREGWRVMEDTFTQHWVAIDSRRKEKVKVLNLPIYIFAWQLLGMTNLVHLHWTMKYALFNYGISGIKYSWICSTVYCDY